MAYQNCTLGLWQAFPRSTMLGIRNPLRLALHKSASVSKEHKAAGQKGVVCLAGPGAAHPCLDDLKRETMRNALKDLHTPLKLALHTTVLTPLLITTHALWSTTAAIDTHDGNSDEKLESWLFSAGPSDIVEAGGGYPVQSRDSAGDGDGASKAAGLQGCCDPAFCGVQHACCRAVSISLHVISRINQVSHWMQRLLPVACDASHMNQCPWIFNVGLHSFSLWCIGLCGHLSSPI